MNLTPEILAGQTILSVKKKGINCWEFRFLNGSSIELWAENQYLGGGVSLPVLYLDGHKSKEISSKNIQKSVDKARKKVNSMTPRQRNEEIKKIKKDFDKKKKLK